MGLIQSQYERLFGQVTEYVQLDEVIKDADFKSDPARWNVMPGAIRKVQGILGQGSYRNIPVNGYARFRLVCNRSGGTLVQGSSCSFYAASATATEGSTSTFTALVGSFLENEAVWNSLYILDDAGGAGAAPETEWGIITKAELNAAGTHITFTVQTHKTNGLFTAAVGVGDTCIIRSRCQVIPCDLGEEVEKYAGVVVRADGIPDNYWGWIAEEADEVAALIKAATVITADRAVRVADDADGATVALSRLTNAAGGSLIAGQCIGYALYDGSGDIASDMIPIRLKGYGVDET